MEMKNEKFIFSIYAYNTTPHRFQQNTVYSLFELISAFINNQIVFGFENSYTTFRYNK